VKKAAIGICKGIQKLGAVPSIHSLLQLAAYIFNFLYGAGGLWSWILYPRKETREEESIESRRYQFMLIFRPVVTSVYMLIVYVSAQFFQKTLNYLQSGNQNLDEAVRGPMLTVLGKVVGVINSFAAFIDTLNDQFSATFGFLEYLVPYNFFSVPTLITIYIFVYKIIQHRRSQRLVVWGENLMQKFPGLASAINGIYVETPGTGKIKLSPRWEKSKEYLQIIVCCNMILFAVLDKATNFADTFWKTTPNSLIPFTGFFCMLEAYHYLSLADIQPNQRKPNKSLDLAALRAGYQQYAGKWNISMTSTYERSHSIKKAALLSAEACYQNMGDPERELLYQYLAERNQLEHMDMAVRLVQQKNIFYASPFFRDIDACIFFVMSQTLMRGKRGLILVSGNEDTGNLIKWMSSGLESVPGVKGLWNVAELKEPVTGLDVGIMLFHDIRLEQSSGGLERFFQETGFVIILDASNMLTGGQETVITLAEHIHQQCTWLLCDWNAESMLDLFSHLLRVEFTYVSATPVGAKETVAAYWDIESEPNRIWDPAKRFLGLEVGIAEVAGRNRLPHTVWYGEEWMPVIDMGWIIGQYYKLYSKKTSQAASQGKMNMQIQCGISGISSSVGDEEFIVVEDSCCNLYETGRQYATRAREKIYVHVLSPNYLLRDFMKSQADTMRYDSKYIAQFVPEYVNSMRNIYLHLLRRLLKEPVAEREINRAVRMCEEPPRPETGGAIAIIEDIVKMLLYNTSFRPEADLEITVRRNYSEYKGGMVHERFFHIIGKDIQNAFRKYFRQACYVDETGERRGISRLTLAGHLQLKYLPGQYITLRGKYYQVEQLLDSDEETLLVVKRASEQVVDRRYYRQLREYKLEEVEEPRKCIFNESGVRLTRLAAKFCARITGYITCRKCWNDFQNALETSVPDGCFQREYIRKQSLCVEIPELSRPNLLYLAAVIHEILYTLYPQYCHLLSVAVCWNPNKDGNCYRGVLSRLIPMGEDADFLRDSCFYIFEDSCEDMGLLRSIERHFRRILQIAADYIKWCSANSLNYFAKGVDAVGNTEPPFEGGTEPFSEGGAEPLSKGGTEPLSEGGTEPFSEGGTEPLSEGGTEPLSEGGTEPLSEGGTEPFSEGGTEPLSEEGAEPPSEGGAEPPSE